MDQFAHFLSAFFFAPLLTFAPFQRLGALDALGWVLLSLVVFRFHAGQGIIWLTWMIKPSWWETPNFSGEHGYPLVSVIIPSRNEGPRVGSSIRSILDCGWPNLEVIVIDDNSSDGSWRFAKQLESTGRVRVFTLERHGGRATALNYGIAAARGDYMLIMDADNMLEIGALNRMMGLITSDPRLAGVGCNFKIANADASLVSTYQEWLSAVDVATLRMIVSKLRLLSIVSGGCGLFRTEIIRGIGGFDTGLGDDTDLTIRLRKARWRVAFCHRAVCWANVHTTYNAFASQQMRWERVLIKIRMRKHWDLILPWRYGWLNMLVALNTLVMRFILPSVIFMAFLYDVLTDPGSGPILLSQGYWLSLMFQTINGFATRDLLDAPRLVAFAYIPVYFMIFIPLRMGLLWSMWKEVFRIGARHRYVPDRIWRESPRW